MVTILPYEPTFDTDHIRVGREVATGWVWPYAYDELSLTRLHTRSDFDPDLHPQGFVDGEMIGCVTSRVTDDDGTIAAWLDFPRVLPGYKGAAQELIAAALAALRQRGVGRVEGRVTTMCPDDI